MSIQGKHEAILDTIKGRLAENTPEPDGPVPQERTAVGLMMGEQHRRLRDRLETAEAEAKAAQEKLQAAEQAGTISLLNAKRVRRSRFADRHEKAFEDAKFFTFLDEIRQTGGNTEPGHVRPVSGDPEFDYEIASGHRRHAACLKLGLPFKAIVQDMTDVELVQQMRRENAGRTELSAYEQGCTYVNMLNSKLYASERDMAVSLNVPRSNLKRLLKFGELPAQVVAAFPDPRAIRVQWVERMTSAYSENPQRIDAGLARVSAKNLSPTDLFKVICDVKVRPSVIANQEMVLGRIREIHGCPAVILYKEAPRELLEKISEVVLEWVSQEQGEGSS